MSNIRERRAIPTRAMRLSGEESEGLPRPGTGAECFDDSEFIGHHETAGKLALIKGD
jgi:hypothetical protein